MLPVQLLALVILVLNGPESWLDTTQAADICWATILLFYHVKHTSKSRLNINLTPRCKELFMGSILHNNSEHPPFLGLHARADSVHVKMQSRFSLKNCMAMGEDTTYIHTYGQTLRLLDRIRPVGRFGENLQILFCRAKNI